MEQNKKIIWSATPTPFLADGSLDKAGIHHLVEQHLRLNIQGLFAAGTTGEGPHMPGAQRGEFVRILKQIAGTQIHLAAQVSDTSAVRVQDNMRRMTDAGADSLVLSAPLMPKFCSEHFLRRYFFESLEAATLPVGIYLLKGGIPGAEISLDLWREIAAHPNVHFLKDSTASQETADALLAVKQQRPELILLTGYEFDVLTTVTAGYDGGLLGTGILNGRMIRHALDALENGDTETAAAWQKRANDFMYDMFRRDFSTWLGGLKYALKRLGIFSTDFMHLCFPLTNADRNRIDAAIEREREFIVPTSSA